MPGRTDEHGRAFKKSQLQMQLWTNRRRSALTTEVLAALPSLAELNPQLTWVSPLESESFVEYQDGRFLHAVERPELKAALASFWPSGGPHWDALAVARDGNGCYLGPVMVEAKSYPREMRSKLSATDPESRKRILQRLAETRAWLSIPEEHTPAWTNVMYQAANRLAHLRFFEQVLGQRAWLANIYFLNDPDHPTTRAQWDVALVAAETQLGLKAPVAGSGKVFLSAGQRSELLAPLGGTAHSP